MLHSLEDVAELVRVIQILRSHRDKVRDDGAGKTRDDEGGTRASQSIFCGICGKEARLRGPFSVYLA